MLQSLRQASHVDAVECDILEGRRRTSDEENDIRDEAHCSASVFTWLSPPQASNPEERPFNGMGAGKIERECDDAVHRASYISRDHRATRSRSIFSTPWSNRGREDLSNLVVSRNCRREARRPGVLHRLTTDARETVRRVQTTVDRTVKAIVTFVSAQVIPKLYSTKQPDRISSGFLEANKLVQVRRPNLPSRAQETWLPLAASSV